MNLVIPMNGEGLRFKEMGYNTWKPFLPVHNKPMIKCVVDHYPSHWRKTIVVWHEYAEFTKSIIPEANIIKTYKRTDGPVHSLLQSGSMSYVSELKNVFIADSDGFLGIDTISKLANYFVSSGADAGSPIRKTNDKWASFCKLDGDRIIETREKDPFTNWSTTGPYYWASGEQYIDCALKSGIHDNSPLFNELIKRNGKVLTQEVTDYIHLGTPELYENYLRETSNQT